MNIKFSNTKIKSGFVVTFHRPEAELPQMPAGKSDSSQKRLVEGSAESQKKILILMQAEPKISKKDLAAAVGIITIAIDKNITILKTKNLLRRIGPDKGGHWEVV